MTAGKTSSFITVQLRNIISTSVLVFVIGGVSPGAYANGGFYFGAGAGQAEYSSIDELCDEAIGEAEQLADGEFGGDPRFDAVFAQFLAGTNCGGEDTDTVLRLFGGYQFNDFFALEAGYVDLGELALDISTNVANSLGTINAAGTANADVSGINLTGSLMLPVHERVSLFGRLGVLAWQADITGSVSGTVTSAGRRVGISETLSTDASGADLSYGFGALFGVTDTVSIRGNFSRYEIADINVFSIDVVFFPK